ncbi:hypothetical protein C8Q76DRAFT_696844 [Earliella scabrosa]|nr:hypothetical protein C8Q76DRAFT_696844 [Earliella scabrosa]
MVERALRAPIASGGGALSRALTWPNSTAVSQVTGRVVEFGHPFGSVTRHRPGRIDLNGTTAKHGAGEDEGRTAEGRPPLPGSLSSMLPPPPGWFSSSPTPYGRIQQPSFCRTKGVQCQRNRCNTVPELFASLTALTTLIAQCTLVGTGTVSPVFRPQLEHHLKTQHLPVHRGAAQLGGFFLMEATRRRAVYPVLGRHSQWPMVAHNANSTSRASHMDEGGGDVVIREATPKCRLSSESSEGHGGIKINMCSPRCERMSGRVDLIS